MKYSEIYFSVWEFSSKEKKTVAKKYLSSLPYDLCEMLVKIGSKQGDTVLDPFCGSGQILLACRNLGRKAIGIDINPEAIKLAEELLCTSLKKEEGIRLILGDCLEKLREFQDCSVDAVITHPPYWRAWKYTRDLKDLSNMKYEEYLKNMEKIFREIYRILKEKCRFIFVIGDCIHRGKFYPIHAHLTVICEKIGFQPRPYGIWVLRGLAYYGFIRPYKKIRDGCFKQFQLSHNYICVFEK